MATRLRQQSSDRGPNTEAAAELLLRNPLTQGYTPTRYQSKSQLYSRNVRPEMAGSYHKAILEDDSPVTSFYTRHNPHPIRVKHLKGLLDNPVCMVEDNLERRLLWSAPSGDQLAAASYRPQGNTRYSANRTKHIPAIGIVPVTYAWKDELEKKAQNAISKALGHQPTQPMLPSIQPHRHLTTEKLQHQHQAEFDSLDDTQLLNLLCKILQTDSIPACQAWLQYASDTEKTIVLNMLRMAATGEIASLSPRVANDQQVSRPSTSQSVANNQQVSRTSTSQSIYAWDPHKTGHKGGGAGTSLPPVNQQHPQQQQQIDRTHQYMDTEQKPMDESVFKLPTHDTIVRSAAQSKQSTKFDEQAFHDRLQKELDHADTHVRRALRTLSSKGVSGRYQSAYQQGSRPTSAGLTPLANLPHPGGSQSRPYGRPRSRSAGSCSGSTSKRDCYPAVPSPNMGVNISRALNRARAM